MVSEDVRRLLAVSNAAVSQETDSVILQHWSATSPQFC